jgi:hypothetical protein
LPRYLQEHDVPLLAEQRDLLHPRDQQQLAAQKLGIAEQLGFREAVAGDRATDRLLQFLDAL